VGEGATSAALPTRRTRLFASPPPCSELFGKRRVRQAPMIAERTWVHACEPKAWNGGRRILPSGRACADPVGSNPRPASCLNRSGGKFNVGGVEPGGECRPTNASRMLPNLPSKGAMTIEKIWCAVLVRSVILAVLLLGAVDSAEASGQPYSFVGKPQLGIDGAESKVSFDTASAYCDRRYGADNDKAAAHKKCMLDRGWRLEKFISCGSTVLHRSC
jgi:hypothetical protein